MKKIKYNDDLEKIITAIFGIIGTLAIFINLYFKGFGKEDVMDAIKDLAGLVVVIAVFLVANKVFNLNKLKRKFDFNSKFEELLVDWANNNKYLIDISNIEKEKGRDRKRTIDMICNHEVFVTGTNLAKDIKDKGAFLYLPLKEEFGKEKNQIIQFKINKGMFHHKKDFVFENERNRIIENIVNRINQEFGNNEISAIKSSEPEKIDVDFSKLDKNTDNAKKLIDVVEFVKTLFLAIA